MDKNMNNNKLPILQVLPLIKETFCKHNSVVLIAEPGAGKTTQTPLALLDQPWLKGKKIIMLEPRRIAARSAASYMAASIGEPVGKTIGYRVRMETRVSEETVIEVVTEGILTRMLQNDPELSNVAMIIFDEFHERSIHADTGLALVLESQSVFREDLKLLIMSATLDAEPVAALLGNAPVIHCTGRSFPVETIYVPAGSQRLEQACSSVIRRALVEEEGDILVFLPGVAEIRRTAQELTRSGLGLQENIVIHELYGQLSAEKQDEAIHPAEEGKRKIVLATSIAETSLTIEGIRIVVDCGLMRTEVFSPSTGLPQLITKRVSKASADQRRGRAGRLAPGVCYRLWSEMEHSYLPEMNIPDIRQTDLTSLALELAVWGVRDPQELSWLDTPPSAAFEQGRELLRQLGAIDHDGTVTNHGRQMSELGMHPRLAHMLLKGTEDGQGALACRLAVLLQERDLMGGSEAALDCDIRTRVERLQFMEQGRYTSSGMEGKEGTIKRIIHEIHTLCHQLGINRNTQYDLQTCGLLLSFAYPDRIAKNRGGGSFLLRSGRGVVLKKIQPLSRAEYIVVAAVDDKGAEGSIQLASSFDESLIWRYYREDIANVKEVVWDSSAGAVRARIKHMFGAIVVKEQVYDQPQTEELTSAVLEGIRREGLSLLSWTKQAIQMRQRLLFMKLHYPEWPDVSDEALLNQLEEWLEPYLEGSRNRQSLQKLNIAPMLENLLTWEQRQLLHKEAPTHIKVPSGSSIPINYQDPSQPFLAVRLQEMFGLPETPRIAGGRVALTIHLLSPAQRPVQVTSDLSSFWSNGYFEVKKDLKGRYPKHYWPDNPLEAVPTNRTRAKM